jgi:hypothetical protein
MDPIPYDQLGIPEEILKLRPPLTPTQGAARRKADEALRANYPKQFVAYLDTWRGDELDRVVVAASADRDEYQRQVAALPPDVKSRIETMQIRDPEEGLRGLYPRLVEGD